MASLSELYSSLDTLKSLGLDVQELQEKIELKENEVLSSEVIPALEEIANILLQSFRKDVRIVIEHRTGEDSKITINKTAESGEDSKSPEERATFNKNNKHRFYVRTRSGVCGVGVYDPVGNSFVLLSGSKINSTTSNSFNRKDAYRDITNNYCNLENGLYVLKKDYTFASPSTASSVVLGRSSNGWTDWKDEQGRSLNTVYSR
ncbi:MAG: DUF4357 domain-containing protein [Prevotellaceae bacterium]|nr:DUF4357 domain-containing protein [Prevotellaceae bacterium]